jgi:hypothetical protein
MPLTYICLPKIEEHYLILGNLMVVNIINPSLKHKIQIEEAYLNDVMSIMNKKDNSSFRISTYFDMVLIQDSELMIAAVFHIRQKGSCLIAI